MHPNSERGVSRNYSYEDIDRILREVCGRIVAGQTLSNICGYLPQTDKQIKKGTPPQKRNPHLPSVSTIHKWTNSEENGFEVFRQRMRRAREASAHTWADKSMEVAEASTPETAHADRVKISAYQWAASKLNNRDYGDRTNIDVTAKVEHTKGQDKAPDWMVPKLVGEVIEGEVVGDAPALQPPKKSPTTH